MIQQVKIYDRFQEFAVNDVVIDRIRKMFGYLGVSEDDIQFLGIEDPFGDPTETCHYIAFRTYSGYVKQCDLDAVLRLCMSEHNWDSAIRTIVIDLHNGKIGQCALEEYPADKEESEDA